MTHSRILKHPPAYLDTPVADCTVAPHRYLWTRNPDDMPDPDDYREVKAATPYKVGEVIWIAYGEGCTRAIISYVGPVRNYYDEWTEEYTVHRETKKGTWSKIWYKVRSGIVQRGYQRAGLAPEMPKGV